MRQEVQVNLQSQEPSQARPEWTSQRAFIVSSVAAAVGLGNLWRFPYMVGENGGGTFIVCILAVGLPLFVLETTAGSLTDRGPVGVFRRISGRWGPGLVHRSLALVVMSYYFVIAGWTLGYLVDSVRGDLSQFEDFNSGYSSVWYFLAVGLLVFLVLRQGTSGVERLSKVLMPALVVMVALLAIYGQTLSGAGEALRFYASFEVTRFLGPRHGEWRQARRSFPWESVPECSSPTEATSRETSISWRPPPPLPQPIRPSH